MRKLFMDFLRRSDNLLFGKHLLLTNTVSSGGLMFIGELAAQKIAHPKGTPVYDKEKVKQLTVVGVSQGPLHHYTYLWMERLLPGNSRQTVMKKILSDQLIVSPVFIVHYFYTAYFLAGKSMREATNLLKEKGLVVYLVDWCFWPGAQAINFYYLPVRYRVLYINLCTMFYNVFLCYVKNKSET